MPALQEAAEELYALPLDEFVPRRNDRAKELRAQDRELAEAVRRLPKPSQAAWTLNTFSRRRREQLDGLLSLGEQLREAQGDLAGDTLRELTHRARPAVRGAARAAAELAAEHDVTLGESAERQVEQTLRAALADERAAQALRSGLLTRALKPGGFGDVDIEGAVAVAPSRATTTAPDAKKRSTRDREQRREAQQAAKAALIELKKADSDLRRQEERLEQLQESAAAAQARARALQEELAQAEQEASEAADAAREARRERDAARTAQRAAARRGQHAQKRLDELGEPQQRRSD